MTAIKKLYDAANVALDVIDDEVAKGFPEPDLNRPGNPGD